MIIENLYLFIYLMEKRISFFPHINYNLPLMCLKKKVLKGEWTKN